ncbi:MAG: hypothetical protein M5U34_14525 [Chloroflexi bacterium]|nr:hypothetical protein [Chloroflexota bacterium]
MKRSTWGWYKRRKKRADLEPSSQDLGTYRALDRLLHQISQKEASVVVLLDEFELLAANEYLTPYFFARLRGLTTKYGLAYLTASQRPLFAITAEEEILSSPFFNIFVTLPLGLYSDEESRSLFSSRLAGNDIQFSEALVSYLLTLVGPHPLLFASGRLSCLPGGVRRTIHRRRRVYSTRQPHRSGSRLSPGLSLAKPDARGAVCVGDCRRSHRQPAYVGTAMSAHPGERPLPLHQ